MRRVLACSVLSVVAACSPKNGGPGGSTQPGVGCPAASNVYMAMYARPPEGQTGHTGWLLPLHAAKVAAVAGQPGYAPIDAAAASAAGVPPAPTSIWLLPPNAPICKATIGRYYAAAIDAPTPNVAYGVELTGCPEPQDPAGGVAIAFASEPPPSECKAIPPRPVAARLGETDEQGRWSPPKQETPLPPAFAAIVPATDCAAPGCERLWSVAEVAIDGKPIAWTGAVNWLRIPPGATADTQCSWPVETFSGVFVAGPDGTPVRLTEGQDHPLALTAVLADGGGPKVLLAEGLGEYAAYDLAAGTARLGRHLVWLIEDPAAYAGVDRIGPECPPAGAGSARR